MRLLRTALLASAMTATAAVALADDHEPAPQADLGPALSFLQKLSTHYSLLLARTFVDITYDRVAVDPNGTDMVISGVKLYPELPWDPEAKCEVTIDRISTDDEISFQTLASGLELSGVKAPLACFERQVAGMMSSFGYDGLTADTVSISVAYNLPSSSAQLSIQAAVADAADVSIDAEFGYVWFRFPLDGYGDPIPVVQLKTAEVSIENGGIWEKLEPMLGAQMGDLSALPQMIEMQGAAMLGDPAFAKNVSTEVARFLKDKDRIVISSAPQGGVWFDEDLFDNPQSILKALQPKVSANSLARQAIIPPDELAAATGDNATLDDAARMKIGTALLTGVGAPRNVDKGMELMMPLAEAWNGDAAAMLAKAAAAAGDKAKAYGLALTAMGGGSTAALGVADDMEQAMPLADVLAAQADMFKKWPGEDALGAKAEAAIKAGDVSGIRKIGMMMASGRGAVRSYENAMIAMTLAAAAGDRSAAGMRDRMNARFGGSAAWSALVENAEATALSLWTREGFGEAVAPK